MNYNAEEQSLLRQRQLAEAMQQQFQKPLASGQQLPGGYFVATNPLQHLAQALNEHVERKNAQKADARLEALGRQKEERTSADMGLLAQALAGRKATPGGLTEDASGNVTQADALSAMSPVESLQRAIPMMGSQMQGMGLQALQGAQTRADQQEFQREQLRLTQANRNPLVEHNFSVGENMVQPHISHDQGRTWQPLPGSKPSAKFQKQVEPAQPAPQPVSTTTVMIEGVPTVVDARVYRPGSNQGIIGPANKPVNTQLPPSAAKEQDENIGAIGLSGALNADIGTVLSQLSPSVDPQTGKEKPPALNLGLFSNLVNQGRQAVGMSTEESRNLGTLKATLEKLRNDSLRLNKGVQTEGDAQRAWNEILTSLSDQEFVKKRLQDVQEFNERAIRERSVRNDILRRNFGLEPMDYGQVAKPRSAIDANNRNTGGGGPQPGTVMEGYRFKGGNPADRNNWEKV